MQFLYFDLGNVLLSFDHARMLKQMAEVADVSQQTMRHALMPTGNPKVGDPQWRLEEGKISEDEYYEHLCDALGKRPPRAELEQAASDIFEPIEGTMQLIERLANEGHRLGILSNTNAIHWRYFFDGRYPQLNSAFEIQLGSFQVQSMKPHPEIFRVAAEHAGVPVNEIFFTDDKQENVDGAAACGFDAVLFSSPEVLAEELCERGIDI